MKKSIIAAVLSLFILTPAVLAEESSKIAIVDMARVGKEAASVQTVLAKVNAAEQSLTRLMQIAETEIKGLKEKEISEEELSSKQKEIQGLIDKRVAEVQATKSAFDLKIKNDIKAVVDQLVKEKSLELILDKAFVAGAGIDVTDEFIAKLEALNPPAKTAN